MQKIRKAVSMVFQFVLAACALAGVISATPSIGQAGQFRAAVVKTDITPDKSVWLLGYEPRQSTGVHDRLYLRIVAMDDGNTQFYLIASDICEISPSLYDELATRVQSETGIKPMQLWWTTTHTHSAPEVGPPGLSGTFLGERYQHDHNSEYTAWLEQQIIDGIKQARANLAPARLGIGWGMAYANINRRGRNEEGPAFLGLNPDGPTDRRIGLIRLEKADGSLLALVANYAMHGTVLGPQSLLISGDAPGIVAQYVEEKVGVPVLYVQGAAGDMAPIYSVYPDFKSGHLDQFQVLLGDKILAANREIGPTTPDVRLSLAEEVVESPRKAGMGWAPDLAKYARTTSTGQQMIRMPIRFLQINNDIAIWSAPIELFCEVAMRAREQSPYPYTLYFGYCNGLLDYLPSRAEFAYGGYEVDVSPFTEQGEDDLLRTVIGHLQGAPH